MTPYAVELKNAFLDAKQICRGYAVCKNCPLYDEDDECCGFHLRPIIWNTDKLANAIDGTINGGADNENNN